VIHCRTCPTLTIQSLHSGSESLQKPIKKMNRLLRTLFGVSIVLILVISGFREWSFISAVLFGAVAQTALRVGKGPPSRRQTSEATEQSDSHTETPDGYSTIPVLTSTFLVMAIVSTVWYFVGVLGNFIFSLFA
jgi:hypothetical protein